MSYTVVQGNKIFLKKVCPLPEPPGLCNILLLEMFNSFLTKDGHEIASSTTQPNSLGKRQEL